MSLDPKQRDEFTAKTDALLDTVRVNRSDFEELCGALADLIVQVSADPEGRMSGLSDQGTRLNWYQQLMPIRERARAILSKVKRP